MSTSSVNFLYYLLSEVNYNPGGFVSLQFSRGNIKNSFSILFERCPKENLSLLIKQAGEESKNYICFSPKNNADGVRNDTVSRDMYSDNDAFYNRVKAQVEQRKMGMYAKYISSIVCAQRAGVHINSGILKVNIMQRI